MNNDDFKPKGKLKALVDVFHKVDVNNDETEILAIIELLERHNWDVKKLSLALLLEHQYLLAPEDLDTFDDILREALDAKPAPKLTEAQKLDRVIEMAKSPRVNYDYEQVKAIAEALKHDDDLAP